MDNLNQYQKAASEFDGKHLLVLAGAGTGKTRTIIARAEYLLNHGVKQSEIVILSFTRKSAKEIAERLKISVNQNVDKSAITGKTFHSWCYEIMHRFPQYFPHHSFSTLDEDDRLSAMALAIGKNFKDGNNRLIKKDVVVNIYSYALNTLCSLSQAIAHVRYSSTELNKQNIAKMVEDDKQLIAPVIKKYIDYKLVRHYIDYDDILNVCADVLNNNSEARKAVSKRFKHILVDEMQDTNPLQYKLLKAFTQSSSLFCVGDDAQSIYAFRGADFNAVHSFVNIIPQAQTCKLLLNYRSTQEILDFLNWILQQSPLNYNKDLKAFRGSGKKPNLIHVDDDWQEADIITDSILHYVADGDKYSDNMVLGRSNFSLSKVEGACISKKIPYVKLGGISLMRSAHVRDVVSAMRIVANNYDEIAWIRFLQLFNGIGEVKATRIISKVIEKESFDDIIDYLQNNDFKDVNNEIPTTLKSIGSFKDNPADAMKIAVKFLQPVLKKLYKDEWQYRSADFEVLEQVAQSTGTLNEFITEFVLDPKADTTYKAGVESGKDAVVLSTIHSAKGLEAKTVHVLGVNPYNYPSIKTITQGSDAVEEERRCLYVAVTRAKDELNIYRLLRTLHTQFDDTDAEIYMNKKGGTVKISQKDIMNPGELIKATDADGHKLEIYVSDFFSQYKKLENSRSVSLYFLDKLPLQSVNVIVDKETRNDFDKFENQGDKEVDFPDFDFS